MWLHGAPLLTMDRQMPLYHIDIALHIYYAVVAVACNLCTMFLTVKMRYLCKPWIGMSIITVAATIKISSQS
jgi:hypothetical protein